MFFLRKENFREKSFSWFFFWVTFIIFGIVFVINLNQSPSHRTEKIPQENLNFISPSADRSNSFYFQFQLFFTNLIFTKKTKQNKIEQKFHIVNINENKTKKSFINDGHINFLTNELRADKNLSSTTYPPPIDIVFKAALITVIFCYCTIHDPQQTLLWERQGCWSAAQVQAKTTF